MFSGDFSTRLLQCMPPNFFRGGMEFSQIACLGAKEFSTYLERTGFVVVGNFSFYMGGCNEIAGISCSRDIMYILKGLYKGYTLDVLNISNQAP